MNIFILLKNQKLFRLLRLLSPRELERFGDYLLSPYFNKSTKAIDLWETLKSHVPEFNEEILKNLSYYEHIYEKPTSVEAVFRLLGRLLEDFLSQEGFREEYYLKKHFLLGELLRIKASSDYEKQYKAVAEKLDREPLRGGHFYQSSFLLGKHHIEYLSNTSTDKGPLFSHLGKTIAALDNNYLLQKLLLSSEYENIKQLYNVDDSSFLIKEIDESISKGFKHDVHSVRIHHLAFRLVSYSKLEDFEHLMSLLKNYRTAIPKEESFTIYTFAANFCIKMLRAEGESWFIPLFSIYQKILELQTGIVNSAISPILLKNVVTVGCRLKKFDEVRALLLQYKDDLTPDYRKSVYHFCMGIIAFREGNLDQATNELILAETTEDKGIFRIDAQFIRLKIYYLAPPDDVLVYKALMKAFRKRVAKSKLSKNRKTAYLNSCKILAAMFEVKTNPATRKTLEKIRQNAKEMGQLSDRPWIVKQLNQ